MARLLRVVNDTNVWLSALYFKGKPAQIVTLIEEKKIISITSYFILNEIKEKMIIKFKTPPFAANATISYIKSLSKIVPTTSNDFNIRDIKDNPILETALNGKCNYLVTGDEDLLTIKKYENMKLLIQINF